MLGSHILLVEDDRDDELLTMRALKKNNILNEVVIVRDGAQALDYLLGMGVYSERDINNLPVVVLLDLKLPKIDGLEVLRRVRENDITRNLPVVILTSSSEEMDIIRSYSLGVNSYVRKPVEFEQFIKAVGLLGMYWVLVNEPVPSKKL